MFEAWLPLKTPLERFIWLWHIVKGGGAAWVWKTITGTAPLALANAVSHAIKSLTQYGLCTQASTPTPDAPVDIVCNNGALRYGAVGANLFDPNPSAITLGWYVAGNNGQVLESQTNFMLSQYIPIEGNKKYVFFGRHKTSNRISSYNRIAWYSASKTYMTTADYPKDGIGIGTAPLNARYARLSCNLSGEPAATGTPVTYEQIADYNWTFAQADAEIPYEPFVGGIYADGTPETLTINGIATIAEADIVANTGLDSTGGNPFANTNRCYTGFGYFPAGTNFIIRSKANSIGGYLFQYSANNAVAANFISSIRMGDAVEADGWYERRATTTQDAWLFAPYGAQKATAISDEWSALMPRATASVPMLLSVGDYKDEVELVGGIKTGKVGIKVLDGTESFSKSSAYGQAFLINAASASWGADRTASVLCTHFLGLPQAKSSQEDNTCFFNQTGHFYFRVTDNSDADAFKAWLAEQYASGAPVIVFFVLAEETTEQGTAHNLHTSNGDNVVGVTANVSPVELEVEYATTEV